MDADSTRAPVGATTFNTEDDAVLACAPTPFAMCLIAFGAASAACDSHREQCRPADDAGDQTWRAYEASCDPLVTAMSDAGLAAVRCPASSATELAEKLELFKAEHMGDYEDIDALLDVLIADARRRGGEK